MDIFVSKSFKQGLKRLQKDKNQNAIKDILGILEDLSSSLKKDVKRNNNHRLVNIPYNEMHVGGHTSDILLIWRYDENNDIPIIYLEGRDITDHKNLKIKNYKSPVKLEKFEPEDYNFKNSNKLNLYTYEGVVKQFKNIVSRNWKAETRAVSVDKAYANLLYQAKQYLRLNNTAKVDIDKSKIIKVEDEKPRAILIPRKKYSSDKDYNIPDECDLNDTNYKLNTKSKELKWSEDDERERYDWYGAQLAENYSTCYKASIDPYEFLRLTMSKRDPENIEEGKDYNTGVPFQKLDKERFKSEGTDMFLEVEPKGSSFKVVGHEGRHRMFGLYKEGIKKAPIIIYIVKDFDKYNPKEYTSMNLIGQFNTYRTSISGITTFAYKNIKDSTRVSELGQHHNEKVKEIISILRSSLGKSIGSIKKRRTCYDYTEIFFYTYNGKIILGYTSDIEGDYYQCEYFNNHYSEYMPESNLPNTKDFSKVLEFIKTIIE